MTILDFIICCDTQTQYEDVTVNYNNKLVYNGPLYMLLHQPNVELEEITWNLSDITKEDILNSKITLWGLSNYGIIIDI